MTFRTRALFFPAQLAVIFLALTCGIGVTGYGYYQKQSALFLQEKRNELTAISELKVREIDRWRREHLNNAAVLHENALLARQVREWLKDPEGKAVLGKDILKLIESLHTHYDYEAVVLADPHGEIRLAAPATETSEGLWTHAIKEICTTTGVTLTNLHPTHGAAGVRQCVTVPLTDPDGSSEEPVAIILLRINPYLFLYPFIQSWPTPSRTAETLLVLRDGDDVLFLNELRHKKDTALTFRLPINAFPLLPAAQAVLGNEGVMEGVDYRGVPVLAVNRPVPGSNWYLITKIDMDEIHAPLREKVRLIGLLTGMMIVASGIFLGLCWLRHNAGLIRRQAETEREKREIAERYAQLTRFANDSIVLSDPNGRLLDINERAISVYGYTRDEFLRLAPGDLRAPTAKHGMEEETRQFFDRNGMVFETLHRRKDGTVFPVEISSCVVNFGTEQNLLEIIRDTSERKQAEEKIVRLNRMYAVLSQINQTVVRVRDRDALFRETCHIATHFGRFELAWVALWDPHKREVAVTACSGALCNALRGLRMSFAEPAFANCPVKAAVLEGKPAACNDIKGHSGPILPCKMIREAGIHSSAAVPLRLKREIIGAFHVFSENPYFFNDDEIKLLDEIGLDISFALDSMDQEAQRLEAQQKLQKSESAYRTLFDSASDAFFIHDTGGRLLKVNQAACNRLGYSRDELLGLSLNDIRKTDELPPRLSLIECDGVSNGSVYEMSYMHRDGALLPCEVSSRMVEFEGSRAVLSIARDISERRKLESQLRQAQKMEAIGTLAGGIAHDFNNILGIIMGYTEIALTTCEEPAPMHHQLQEVLKASHRAAELVKQILAFSRQTEHERKPARIDLIVKESLKLLRASLPSTIEISYDIGRGDHLVLADPIHIHQIIMNLCTNAHHAMRNKGGTLTISLEKVELGDEDKNRFPGLKAPFYERLAVSDTGYGIEKSVLERIFEPYFTTKGPGEGTGLGLAVVHGLIKDLGGAIDVKSSPGDGATFTLLLPSLNNASAGTVESSFSDVPRGTERVMVVDDENALLTIAGNMLRRIGYTSRIFTSSLQALDHFRDHSDDFDLIITDKTMPKLTGPELAREIKGIRPDIPVILCTGFNEASKESEPQGEDIRLVLMKPFTLRDLASAIRQALDAPRQ